MAIVLSAAAQAQSTPPMKPGLWQIRSERAMNGQTQPDMSERLKTMSPELRKRMEASMKQQGVDASGGPGQMKMCMPGGGGGGASLEQQDATAPTQQGRCKKEVTQQTSNSWKWRSVCTRPDSETVGEATFADAENYTVKSTTTTKLRGQARTTQMTTTAKWLSDDCGSVKPYSPMPPPPSAKP